MKEKENDSVTNNDLLLNIPRIYSNAVKIVSSFYDFQLLFGSGIINVLEENSTQIIESKFLVQLSPQHYKVLLNSMQNQLDEYEKKFGEIKLPED